MGPLDGCTIIELAGIGPAPFAGMLLADMGADVIRVDRTSTAQDLGIPCAAPLQRAAAQPALDQGRPQGPARCRRRAATRRGSRRVDRGFPTRRVERLGIGPAECLARNPELVYGRMTGWGQDGPLAARRRARHQLHRAERCAPCDRPGRRGADAVPLNLVGDFGGGGVYLALGVLAAMLSARTQGSGQVVDAAMIDGAASLMAAVYGMHGSGLVTDERGIQRRRRRRVLLRDV